MKRSDFLKRVITKDKGRIILAFVTILIYSALTLVSPLIISFLIDNVIKQEPLESGFLIWVSKVLGGVEYLRDNLWLVAVVVLGINLVIGLLYYLKGRLNAEIAEDISKRIKDWLYRHISLLPYKFHVKSSSGDLIQRCTSDVEQIRRVFAVQIGELVYAVSLATLAIVIMFSINVKLALLSIIMMPVLVIFAFIFFKKMQQSFLETDIAEGKSTTVIQENLSAIRVVKAFNREAFEVEKFEEKNYDYKQKGTKLLQYLGYYWGISDFISYTQILIVTIAGVIFVGSQEISVGQFLVFITYESMIVYPIRQIGRILADIGKVTVSIDRLLEILNEEAEDIELGLKPVLTGAIKIENLKFKYDYKNILSGINMEIKAGETVAIIGTTGSGKTTLMHLLCRLYEYDEGQISLDGYPLESLSKKHVRENIGIVLQEPYLFSRTIANNIAATSKKINEEAVILAADTASVHEVIQRFELGYQTIIGEKGVTLSGGQKQRVAIARTIIKKTPILIFDDSLSAVDTETDAIIRQKLKERNQGQTTIIITQRVSSARDADNIFILDDGKIVQSGTHEELIAQAGLYQRINEIQMQIGDN